MKKRTELKLPLFLFLTAMLFTLSSCMVFELKRINKYNRNNEKTGYWIIADSTGWIELQHYSNGLQHGKFKRFREKGQVAISGRHKNGIKVGTWRYYNENGQVISWSKYHNGNVYKQKIGSISF